MYPNRILLLMGASVMLSAAPFTAAVSQDLASLKAGEQIRFTLTSAPKVRAEASFASMGPDAIRLSGAKSADTINLASIMSLEVRRRTPRKVFTSAGVGLFAGFLGGWIIGGKKDDLGGGFRTLTHSEHDSEVGAVAGAAVGAFFGFCCSSTWQPVAIPLAR